MPSRSLLGFPEDERGQRLQDTHGLRRGLRRGLAFALSAALWMPAPAAEAADRPAADATFGEAAYQDSCARCHGVSARGDGVDAKRFYPRPRDLSLGVYKFRSTASGTPPTDEDLFRTITNGLPGTNMPDWHHLDEATRWQLVYYLKSLSPFFQETEPSPLALADDPGPRRADRAKGKVLFDQLGCAACHGASGRADGPSAAGLVDDWGMPVRPADLTQGWSYRGGADARSVALRIMTGIDGAGMPSYAEAISPEDVWHLAYYVTALQEPAHWNMVAHPLRVEGSLPMALDDPRWDSAERTDVRLRNVVTPEGEWANPPTVKAVSFRALYNATAIAFRFSWSDPTQESASAPDGLALVLKPDGAKGDVVTLQAWPYRGAPVLDLCYWSADQEGVSEVLAADFEGVRGQHRQTQEGLSGVAHYEKGRWQLILQRPLEPSNPEGASAMSADGFTSLAFAVWDGGNPSARAVSPWVEISLRESRSSTKTH